MEKYHTIHFYDLFNQTQNETTSQILQKCFYNGKDVYSFDLNGEKYNLEILDFDENHYFGKLSRDEDYKESLITIKTRKDQKPLNPSDFIFEKFTFFYIKFDHTLSKPSHISAINNTGIKIDKCFERFFMNDYLALPIRVFPTWMSDIEQRIENLEKINNIECTFSDTSTYNNRSKFNDLFNFNCYLKNVKFKLTFTDKKPNIVRSFIDDPYKYKSLKITGKNNQGKTEYIDILKQIFTKKSKIELSAISLNNFEPIKKALNDFSDL